MIYYFIQMLSYVLYRALCTHFNIYGCPAKNKLLLVYTIPYLQTEMYWLHSTRATVSTIVTVSTKFSETGPDNVHGYPPPWQRNPLIRLKDTIQLQLVTNSPAQVEHFFQWECSQRLETTAVFLHRCTDYTLPFSFIAASIACRCHNGCTTLTVQLET